MCSPLVVWLIIAAQFRAALGLVAFAGLTDWFDGFAARKLGQSGKIGAVMDPMADKLMLVTLFSAATYVALLPVWMLVLVLGRDLVIVVGALLLKIFRGISTFVPSVMGKVSTFFQIVLVLMVLLYAGFPLRLFYWLEELALVLCTIFTAWSGIGYVRLGIQMTRRQVS